MEKNEENLWYKQKNNNNKRRTNTRAKKKQCNKLGKKETNQKW